MPGVERWVELCLGLAGMKDGALEVAVPQPDWIPYLAQATGYHVRGWWAPSTKVALR